MNVQARQKTIPFPWHTYHHYEWSSSFSKSQPHTVQQVQFFGNYTGLLDLNNQKRSGQWWPFKLNFFARDFSRNPPHGAFANPRKDDEMYWFCKRPLALKQVLRRYEAPELAVGYCCCNDENWWAVQDRFCWCWGDAMVRTKTFFKTWHWSRLNWPPNRQCKIFKLVSSFIFMIL